MFENKNGVSRRSAYSNVETPKYVDRIFFIVYHNNKSLPMFSKLLVKLIDEAIVPAILLVAVRIISLVLVSKSFDIPINLGPEGFVYSSSEDYLLVNSHSLLYMVLAICLGLLRVIIKSVVFHDTHITPPLAAKLHSLRLEHLIQDTFHLYTQGVVWLAYLYFLTIGAGLMSLFGLIYGWVVWASLGLAVLFTYIFILDAEREILAHMPKKR